MKFMRTLILFMISSSCLMFSQLETDSWARLKPPGLTEAEIKHEWREFTRVKDTAEVRGNYPFMKCFEKAARKYNLPLSLLLAVARGESNFDPKAKSIKDCYGIMQIRWPGTAKDLGITRKSELFDPCTNIDAGARYLSWLLETFNGDIYLAVAAYNYGPNAVAPKKVPKGAQWYAAYIHRHLKFVMTRTFEKTGRLLILEYTFYKNAASFMAHLEKQVGGVPFEIFKSRKYTYDIYFTYRTSKERDNYLKLLQDKTGIKPLGGGTP